MKQGMLVLGGICFIFGMWALAIYDHAEEEKADRKFRDDNKELYLLCADSLGISNDSSPLDKMQIRECVKWEKWKNN